MSKGWDVRAKTGLCSHFPVVSFEAFAVIFGFLGGCRGGIEVLTLDFGRDLLG